MIRQVTFGDLVGSRSREILASRRGTTASHLFADVHGFHIYGDLRLNLPLSAASDARNASKYLNILDHYALLADVCAGQVGAELLEIQGERIHLLLPAATVDEAAIVALLRFSISLTQVVFRVIKPMAGDHWDGFALAADHGRAVIIATGRDGDDSIVSLGNPANTPAKRLARDPLVPSGHLAVPATLAESSSLLSAEAAAQRRTWIEINVNAPPQYLAWVIDQGLTGRMEADRNFALANDRPIRARAVSFANADQFAGTFTASLSSPVTVQGLCLRADLDGFTAQVEDAFDHGESAIRALIQRFLVIMEFPDLYARKINRPTIALPFAGDCANRILLLKPGESYETIQKFLPATAALAWHDGETAEEERIKSIRKAFHDARWSIGIAGGDDDEGSRGHMLVADIGTSRRDFRVAAGWAVRRSLDTQQAKHVIADDTVIHIVDHRLLDPSYRDTFNPLPESTIFRRATLEDLKKACFEKIKTEGKPTRVEFPYVTATPALITRPFGC